MTEVQKKLLKMLLWFHDYCCENKLTYYIVGGSMLGAVRHGGFIPWDDDIDVVLPRPCYEKLLNLCQGIHSGYLLESPYTGNTDYYYSYAKLYDTSTTLIEHTRRDCRRGLYIDVFPLDGLGKEEKEVEKNFARTDLLNMFLMTRTCDFERRRGIMKNAAIALSRMIPSFIINDNQLAKKVDRTAASFGYNESRYVGNLMGAYRKREVMEKRIFGKPTEYEFEGHTVYGVELYNEFLTHIYGNWRELPSEDKRQTVHNFVKLDLNQSYLDDANLKG